MTASLPIVTIYTDGACSGNPGPGGWGAVLIYGSKQREIYGGEPDTTNNRMELLAAIRALEVLTKRCEVALYTDSSYVRDGIMKWINDWKKNGWKTAKKTPVKNIDLWQQLDVAIQAHTVTCHWVKGHNGDPMNELADSLASQGIQTLYINPAVTAFT